MEQFISNSAETFSQFLTEKVNVAKNQKLNTGLFSFAIPLVDFTASDKLNYLIRICETSFYYEKPDEKFSFLGMNEILAIAENGDRRFAATDKKIKEWDKKFFNNWGKYNLEGVPLFMGGMKFSVEHSDDDWKDFNDSTWFIPEQIILNKNEKKYFIYNFILSANGSKGEVINKFKKKLYDLLALNPEEQSPLPEVVKQIGSNPKDKKKWKKLVNQGLDEIMENKLDKIVLSRKVEIQLSEEPSLDKIIEKLRENYFDCHIFIYHHGKSNFLGATPERLAKFSNGKFECDAIAGSAPRGLTKEEDELLENELLVNEKNLNEHKFVVEHIRSIIAGITNELSMSRYCEIKKLANIQHIWTTLEGKMNENNSILSILNALYPTPAICGFPKDTALGLIKKLEDYRRGMYSGIIGWFNFDDEGEFVVALRSALNFGTKLIAYAGGGIVEHSDPDKEFEETELKLKPILSLFNNEYKN